MAVFHQMGHDSENLLREPQLNELTGAILSPVNYDQSRTTAQIQLLREAGKKSIFDPQLYYPRSERGCLRDWSHYPTDVDTADVTSERWWEGVVANVAETVAQLSPDAACAPAFCPNVFPNEYYLTMNRLADRFAEVLEGTGVDPINTLVVRLGDLAQPGRSQEIASIASRGRANSLLVIFLGETAPRRELANSDELLGAMRLLTALHNSGMSITVGFCSTESVLWKAAGADNIATGKFFNLRRFTRSRFDEPTDGGGQLPYWFEESLMAFVRESDLLRLQRAGLLSEASLRNPFGQSILEQRSVTPPRAWIALSWRQYLWGMADLEKRLDSGAVNVQQLLREAETQWLTLEDRRILMEEARNDGGWIRQWRRAVIEQ